LAASIFNGDAIKLLKEKLRFKSGTEIISNDSDDPTSVAKDAPIGSIYIRSGTGEVYVKQDAGSSTNWKQTTYKVSVTANRALVSDGNGDVTSSSVTDTEIGYVSGVTSSIQTQVDSKLNLSGGTMTGTLVLDSDGASSLDAVTKQQLDAALDGVQRKQSVVVATTSDITLSGEQTIDGVLTSASRVLVKDQSTQTENGIYVSDAGAWSRSSDANTSSELNHAVTSVESGTANADTAWEQTTDSPNIGVDNVVWAQTYGAGTYTADGQGIELSGS
jgi:flagellar hook-basal body complex protein FliE